MAANKSNQSSESVDKYDPSLFKRPYDVCRFCLQKNLLKPMSTMSVKSHEIPELFAQITGITLELTNEYSEWICSICVENMNTVSRIRADLRRIHEFWNIFLKKLDTGTGAGNLLPIEEIKIESIADVYHENVPDIKLEHIDPDVLLQCTADVDDWHAVSIVEGYISEDDDMNEAYGADEANSEHPAVNHVDPFEMTKKRRTLTASNKSKIGRSEQHISVNVEQSVEQSSKESELKALLKSWNFMKLYEFFKSQHIFLDELRMLRSPMLQILLKDFLLLGEVIRFDYKLDMWKNGMGFPNPEPFVPDTHTADRSPSPASISSSPALENLFSTMAAYKLSIIEILNDDSQGTMLQEFYKKNGGFTEMTRITFVDTVANYFIRNNINLTGPILEELTIDIVKTFPGEMQEYYYDKSSGATPRGKLYNKYHNIKSRLRRRGLLRKGMSTEDHVLKQGFTPKRPLLKASRTEVARHIQKLNCASLSMTEKLKHWRGCVKHRFADIRQTQDIASIMLLWPQYKYLDGLKYVNSDFEAMYQSSQKLLANTQKFYEKMLEILNKQLKDINCVKLLQRLKNQSNLTENDKFCGIFTLLHGILVPRSKITTKSGNGKSSLFRHTIKDSQNSFIFCVTSENLFEEHIAKDCNKVQTTSPMIVVISDDILHPKTIFTYFSGVKYMHVNIVEAIDSCFKIYHVFNLEYPTACVMVWEFIQEYFYDISCARDKKFHGIKMLINDLNG